MKILLVFGGIVLIAVIAGFMIISGVKYYKPDPNSDINLVVTNRMQTEICELAIGESGGQLVFHAIELDEGGIKDRGTIMIDGVPYDEADFEGKTCDGQNFRIYNVDATEKELTLNKGNVNFF